LRFVSGLGAACFVAAVLVAVSKSVEHQLATAGAVIAVLTAIVGTTIAVESRYAKAADVKEQLNELYAKQLKLKVLELDLKADPTPADRAMRQYLLQELQKSK
jgi:hypothetical protein